MNWKEQLNQRVPSILDRRGVIDLEDFISTEIIEKLIEDIPDDYTGSYNPNYEDMDLIPLKIELRNKWL